MKSRLIRKYCDNVLRYLYKNEASQVEFATGKFNGIKVESNKDIFSLLNIPDDYRDYILKRLKTTGYIEVYGKSRENGWSQELKKDIEHLHSEIKITDLGKVFIGSSSFRKENISLILQKWLSHWFAAISATVAIISVIVAYNALQVQKQEKPEIMREIELKLKEHDEKMHIPAQVENSKDTTHVKPFDALKSK